MCKILSIRYLFVWLKGTIIETEIIDKHLSELEALTYKKQEESNVMIIVDSEENSK